MAVQAAGTGRILMEQADILQYFSRTRAGFLHAVGEPATERLLALMDVRNNDSVLELGFGTGATLVKLVSRYKSAQIHGLERSIKMFEAAKARMKFCGLENHDLKHTDALPVLPYADNTFDKVIIESVLAIQEENDLSVLIGELHRVLKPGGRLFANETLWLPSVSNEEIRAINGKCKNGFGIIQSNGICKDQGGWKSFLTNSGFKVQRVEVIDELKDQGMIIPKSFTEMRSGLFTFLGKYRGKMDRGLKSEYHSYKKHMEAVYERGKKYMEGVIMVAQKNSPEK
jgi:ubiquinone/menaquinone biosynthesis C-methylase UbiE